MNVAFRVFCDFLTLFSRPKEEPFGYLYYPVGERLIPTRNGRRRLDKRVVCAASVQ